MKITNLFALTLLSATVVLPMELSAITPEQKKAKAEAAAKAKADAALDKQARDEFAKVNKQYSDALKTFKQSSKKATVSDMVKAANDILNFTKWKSPSPRVKGLSEVTVLKALLPFFEEKQLSAAKVTIQYYDRLNQLLPEGREKVENTLKLTMFKHRLMLIDDATAEKTYAQCIQDKSLQPIDKVEFLLMCGKNLAKFSDFCKYRNEALKIAGDDTLMLSKIYAASFADLDRERRKAPPDKMEWVKKLMNDPRMAKCLFGNDGKVRFVFRSNFTYVLSAGERLALLEPELKKSHSPEELYEIHALLVPCYKSTWQRYYLDSYNFGGFSMPIDPDQPGAEPTLVNKAFNSQKYLIDNCDRNAKGFNEAKLVPLYLDLLGIALYKRDTKVIEDIGKMLEKDCASVRDMWIDALNACRAIDAFRLKKYQTVYDIGKKIDLEKIRKVYAIAPHFMDAYVRSMCALRKYREAYEMQDKYLEFVIPNWYYQQKNRVKKQFESIKRAAELNKQ